MTWISVKDALPKIDGDYLSFAKCPKTGLTQVFQRRFLIEIGFIPSEHNKMITHWMPLPNPPEENEKSR